MRKRKEITIKIPEDEVDFFGAVLTSAVRYCLGRATYMPGLVTGWIMEHCEGFLKGKTLSVMKRDIDEASERNGLGMDCDKRTWRRFREWVVKEEERWEVQQIGKKS